MPSTIHPEPPAEPPIGALRRTLYVLGPFVLTALVLCVIYLVADRWTVHQVWITGLVSLLGAGTTVVFGEAALGEDSFHLHLGTWELAYVVMYVNTVSGWFYTYNLDLLQRVPRIGPWLRRARRNARIMLQQRPWIRRWAMVGVCLFVVTPLPGSGALGGSLVGRLVGISKRATVVAVALAGVAVSSLYALLASELKLVLDRVERFAPPWVRLAVFLLVAIVLIWLMTRLVRWLASQPIDKCASADSSQTPR
ncbi:MAG: small multi-drug export protein [Planctomycetota bacterium]|nr:small multi-drug export protein [Planctomycetota bacterium]